MHAFDLPGSLKAFRAAQRQDPSCAMCFAGEALALGPTVNYEMSPAAHQEAQKALSRALPLAANATPANRALIEALQVRYRFEGEERRAAYRAYAEAVDAITKAHPGEDEFLVLAADAWMMADRHWWDSKGSTPTETGGRALALLERVLRRHPDNTAAVHLYIHLTEKSDRPERAEPYVGRLAALAPGASHMIHMASHVYFRLGRYREATRVNLLALAADERDAKALPNPVTLQDSPTFRHNAYFGMTAALMWGDKDTARRIAGRLLEGAPLNAETPAWTFAIYALAFRQVETPRPSLEAPFLQAMWRYAHAEAALRQGRTGEAGADLDQIERIRSAAGSIPQGPQAATVQLAALDLKGRLALARGDVTEAVTHYRAAADMQDRLPILDPPVWPHSLRRSLAAVLLRSGNAADAKAEAERVLAKWPNDPLALLVEARADRRLGQAAAAAGEEAKAVRLWHGGAAIRQEQLP